MTLYSAYLKSARYHDGQVQIDSRCWDTQPFNQPVIVILGFHPRTTLQLSVAAAGYMTMYDHSAA